jgi:hypothetical protein
MQLSHCVFISVADSDCRWHSSAFLPDSPRGDTDFALALVFKALKLSIEVF